MMCNIGGRWLSDLPETACDNKADSSAYWAPSLKLPAGLAKPTIRQAKWNSIRCKRSRRVSNYVRATIAVRSPANGIRFLRQRQR
ncbi:hypothetical protein HV114_11795 [Klebsiella grimontii]|nr:hypothetical protein [Klebsiella grimontii]QLP41830.1 hypothetical protein HV112_12155 [Klebsiella grimontii]QLU56429.1 hypothetical protein HV114_11795 [Klebsiella grimontii]